MNILYTNFHLSHGGGHTTYVRYLLRNKLHNTFVACPPESRLYKTLKEEGFSKLYPLYFHLPLWNIPAIVKNAIALRRIINERNIDVVHTNGSADNRLALYASWLPGKPFKVVLTKHHTKKVKGVISVWRFQSFNDAVIFVSEAVIEQSGFTPGNSKFHIVENGIDTDHWRKQTPVQTGHILKLVSNAGTQRHKQWHVMAEAMNALPDEQKARLSMVVLGRLSALREEDTQDPKVAFPGFMEDPRPYLDDADIGFLLSIREASSFASREMASMSLPVVCSNFPNYREYINENSGWVTPSGDVEAVKKVLETILSMPPKDITAMKLAAREKAETEFSVERMIERTNAVYEALDVSGLNTPGKKAQAPA